MYPNEHTHSVHNAHRCCGCSALDIVELNRRGFLEGAVLGGTVLSGLAWPALAVANQGELPLPPPRRPLVVKPVLIYSVPTRQSQTSWRSWGGIETEADARNERARINAELEKIGGKADFPVKFLAVAPVKSVQSIRELADLKDADVLLVYAAGGEVTGVETLGKDVIFFLRHRSGPVSLWYEIVSPRLLRKHTDDPKIRSIDAGDVVVDNLEELTWRLRSLCGLVNTQGARIVAVGGPGAWAHGKDVVDMVKAKWRLDIRELPYDELGSLIKTARADHAAVALAKHRAEAYLKLPGTSLETAKPFVQNAMLLDQVFRGVLADQKCRMITINACMGTIMPISETTACLPLSTLNDDGYLAFCESDFVVIPAGILMASISGHPMFLNDPTYPHDGLITLAHCTAPRKLDGKTIEPARILTHFESDYGAAPKVEMRVGQQVTCIIPDFSGKRWVGFLGEIAAHPFLPVCRSQIDVKFTCDSQTLAEHMPGFHWMVVYGNYLREAGYALKKVPITIEKMA
ncbi:MAG: sugar isomerase [Isosphaeraceae bacterium]